jgi:hypothetical protein
MGITALWYAGILTVVMIALQIFFKETDADMTLVAVSDISTRFYMLVTGIVYPLVYFSHYLAVGLTRKQFAFGIFAAGALLSLCFSILRIPLLIIDNEFSLLAILVTALYGVLAMLVGWTTVVGFHYMRCIPIIASIVFGMVIGCGLMTIAGLQLPLLACIWISVSAILVIGTGLLLTVRRIPVKS